MKETLAWRKEFQVETLRDCFKQNQTKTKRKFKSKQKQQGQQKHDYEGMEISVGGGWTGKMTNPNKQQTLAAISTSSIKEEEEEDDCYDGEEKKDFADEGATSAAEFRDILREENAPGKIYVRGYDKGGRAVVYMRPGLENTNNFINNMRHLVWNMEKAIAATEKNGLSKIVFIIDYEGFSLLNAPPLSTARYTLDLFQKHYPERCFRFYLTHPPFIFRASWSAIKGFVDPHTKEKINFCSGKKDIAWLVEELGGNSSRIEAWVGGTNANLKPFCSDEYLAIPFEETYDEKMWK